jgi:hypothetical protein
LRLIGQCQFFGIVAQRPSVGYDAIMMSVMENVPNDTDKETERIYLKLLREAPAWRKAAMVDSLTRACRELAVAGIRMIHPNISEKEIHIRVAALWLDRDLMMRMFNWDPACEGY